MALNKFRTKELTWDKATRRIYDVVRVASSDENGRKLVVQVLNGGQVEDLSGVSLNLYWETGNKKHNGLDAFDVVDASEGIFEIYFTTGMLSNIGKLVAHLQLVDSKGTVTSEPFTISVFRGVDNEAIESSDSFSTLAKALVDVTGLTAQLAQKANQRDVFLKSQGININDFDEDTRQTFLEQQGIDVNYVLGKGNVVEENIGDSQVSAKKTTFLKTSTNLVDTSKAIPGVLSSTDGSVVDSSNYFTSDFIKVSPDIMYFMQGVTPRLCRYDENYNHMSNFTSSEPANFGSGGASYFRVSFHKDDFSVVQVSEGDVNIPYEPYYLRLDDALEKEYGLMTSDEKPTFSKETIRFEYDVYVDNGREVLENDSAVRQIDTQIYKNAGLLKLPTNYDHFGTPHKLIIWNSGSGGYTRYNQSTFGSMYEPYVQYLADEGYAVLDLYSWTEKYKDLGQENFGSPISISAIIQGYKHVVANYNISESGVFTWGYSAGGYHSSILDTNKGIPVLATGMFAPGISPIHKMFGYDHTSSIAYAEDMGFTEDNNNTLSKYSTSSLTEHDKQYIRENARAMIGYNGFWNGIVGTPLDDLVEYAIENHEGDEQLFSGVYRTGKSPTKIWVSEDDDAINVDIIKNYLLTIRNGHGVGELRLMPNGTGGHYSVTNSPDALKVDNITTKLGITHMNIPVSFVELVQFYRRYENG